MKTNYQIVHHQRLAFELDCTAYYLPLAVEVLPDVVVGAVKESYPKYYRCLNRLLDWVSLWVGVVIVVVVVALEVYFVPDHS